MLRRSATPQCALAILSDVTMLLWLSVAAASALTLSWWSGDDPGSSPLLLLVPAAWAGVFVLAAIRRLWRKLIGTVMLAVALNGSGVAGWTDSLRSAPDGDGGAPSSEQIRLD